MDRIDRGGLLVGLGAILGEGSLPLLLGETSAGQTFKDAEALENVRDVDFVSELTNALQKDSIASICLRATPLDKFRWTEPLRVDREEAAAVELDVLHLLGDSDGVSLRR